MAFLELSSRLPFWLWLCLLRRAKRTLHTQKSQKTTFFLFFHSLRLAHEDLNTNIDKEQKKISPPQAKENFMVLHYLREAFGQCPALLVYLREPLRQSSTAQRMLLKPNTEKEKKKKPAAGEENFFFYTTSASLPGKAPKLLVYLREPPGPGSQTFILPPRPFRPKGPLLLM